VFLGVEENTSDDFVIAMYTTKVGASGLLGLFSPKTR
jgi:hypothetical protein